MAGPGFELRTSCTGRANGTHTPPRQNTLALPKCPAVRDAHHATCVYYLSADSTGFGTSNRFSRAHCKLMQTASPARRWRASSPPFFANLSPPAGAREHRAKVLWFCSIMFARTPSQLFEAFECQHHPGLSKVSHSQLWQLHADKIMTFRHQTIA